MRYDIKSIAIVFFAAVILGTHMSCQAREGLPTNSVADVNKVEWKCTSRVVTNEVTEAEYNIRTNGCRRVDELGRMWSNHIFLTITNGYYAISSGDTRFCWASSNQGSIVSPDPFAEKVTVTYFTEEREDTYTIIVGPLSTDFAVVRTVLSRWKTRRVQKLNMTESTEKVNE